ncbi:MAG: DUF302 domain-containing protein [Saprospiraceae bacterium]|mgnify:FL=1|jgi:uncharacterized protein (DUF302 family)|nr:MAG: hypothetical protein UZ08_BCD001001122 [Candidatus Parvibacillus calidus]MCB0589749.1 DUF302 domain-containing protein [Saprospiraceae bacterium]MBK7739942.1 DUF302 domain-containing protein [Candidatus Parvibacillus calidus]MCC7149168.1 DUF302 domain-containing protein [Saprospiraceae bacterium]MCO6470800.1 DUF302 domain-containing protein [Saprospiraceae bacterium]
MSYHFSKTLHGSWEEVRSKVESALKEEGFGVLTEIDISATFKKKLDVDFRPYVILGACNPNFAHQALQAESHIGTMLPCNVIMQENKDGTIEVSAVDPLVSMQGVQNTSLAEVATQVQTKLKRVIENLG